LLALSALMAGGFSVSSHANASGSRLSNGTAERVNRRIRVRDAAAYSAKANTGLSPALPPVTITVDRTDDAPAAFACTVAPNDCSLRGAVAFANLNPGTTINIPAGTYQLTIPGGASEGFSGNNSIGDLDITANNTTIVGAGAASTIIQQTQPNDRVIEVNPFLVAGFVFSISDVTITGGHETTAVGGGGMIAGAGGNVTTVANCVFSGNSATGAGTFGGGGISNVGGNLTLTGCTFTGNSTSASGGGVGYSGGDGGPSTGVLTVTSSTFTNNTAASAAAGGAGLDLFDFNGSTSVYNITTSSFQGNSAANGSGGAIVLESGGPLTITKSSFAANHAGRVGGAINTVGTATSVAFSRFAGNTATTPTNGLTIFRSAGTLTADDNWWGVNSGPGANDIRSSAGTVAVTTWLQLENVASPNSICAGATSTLTADIKRRNVGPNLTIELNGLPAFPVPAAPIFGNAVLGTLSGASTQFVDGTATATFTAGSTPGTGGADATADNETATASIVVQATTTTTNPGDQAACQGATATFSTTASGQGPFHYAWTLDGSSYDGDNSSISVPTGSLSIGPHTVMVTTTGACGSASQSATLTVQANTSTTTPADQTVCQGTSASFSTTASGTGPFHYAWTVDGSSFNGDSSSINVPTGSLSVGPHTVAVTTTGTCGSDSKSATLTVQENTSATTPADQTVCQGATASFSTTASGAGPLHYAWTVDGSSFNGDSSSINVPTGSLSVGNHPVAVTVSGTCGSVTKNATLTVQANTSATTPADQSVCPGVTANFSTTASGTGPFHYAWTLDGSPYNGDSASISVPTGSLSSGNHPVTVTVSGTCGSVTKNATLTVKQNTSTTKPSDQTVCAGSTASFSTTASGTGPFTFVWKKGATVLHTGDLGGRVTITSSSTTSTLTISNVQSTDAGTYSVETTGSCGTATQSATLALDSTPPTITCPSNITVEPTCPSGAVVTYTTPVGTDNCSGATTVRTAGLASGSVFPIGTTTVTYTVTDTSGNSASCSFTVTVETPQAAIQDLINRVQALINQGALNQQNGQGLINKLQAALDDLNNGNTGKACDELDSFIDKVQGYIQHGTLTPAQGQPLIDSARHVKNTLGCNGTSGTCT